MGTRPPANPMQQTAIEEPRVRGVGGGGGERALTTFKTSVTFQRAFKTPKASLEGSKYRLRSLTNELFSRPPRVWGYNPV